MIVYKQGNILDAPEKIICQQVNHQGVMGSGLALQIRNKYPDVVVGYKIDCREFSWKRIAEYGLVNYFNTSDGKIIANIFGQENYGNKKRHTDYNAIKHGLIKLSGFAYRVGESIAIPYKMGCGLGGGDWNIVSEIINDIWWEENVFVYKYKQGLSYRYEIGD